MEKKKETLAERIKNLRKEKKMTQLELAELLNVTDKAVSKWETDEGNPDISLLSKLSDIFGVSIDYLLTGVTKEKIVVMSATEKIALDDDVDGFKKVLFGELERSDETGTTILQYIYRHKSKKIFDYCLKRFQAKNMLAESYGRKPLIDDFVLMCFETDNMEVISDSNPKAFVNISRVYFEGQKIPSNINQITYTLKTKFVDYILENNKIIEYILSQGDVYWSNALVETLEKLVAKKDNRVERILSFIEIKNQEAITVYKTKKDNYSSLYLRDDGVYGAQYPYTEKRVISITTLNRQTVLNALLNNDYELAERLNKQAGNIVSDHELKMDKVSKDSNLTKDEKLIESVMFGNYVDIDKLIALDDYRLYKKVIVRPASRREYALNLAREKKIKELFEFAVKEQMNNTIDSIKKDFIEKLENSINSDLGNKNDKLNSKYLIVQTHLRQKEPIGKGAILFEDIINHKDIEFFNHACESDSNNKDWALEEIVKNRPSDHEVIMLLLEAGAKLHKRWNEDDGWGYNVSRDEIDEIGTQLLKNQTIIFLKEKK